MIARATTAAAALCALALAGGPLAGQEAESAETSAGQAEMTAAYERAGTPGTMHEVLARTVGTWSAEVKMWMEPGGEPTVAHTTSVIEPVMGGRFVRETLEGEAFGAPFRGVGLMGYNNVTGKAQGVWYDNHSTALYRYEGTLSEDGTLELTSGRHDPVSGEWIEARSVRRMEGPDRMVDTAWEKRGGEMVRTMEIVYTRQR